MSAKRVRRRRRDLRRGALFWSSLLVLAAVLTAAAISEIRLGSRHTPEGDSRMPTLLIARVGVGEKGTLIPKSFLGISTEWPSVAYRTGTPSGGPNLIYDRLIQNLRDAGDGTPTLRVGGDFQDAAWWNPAHTSPPWWKGVEVSITPSVLQGLRLNALVTHQRMILGVNLAADDPRLARNEVAAMLHYLGLRDVIAFEIGNEPESYTTRPLYIENLARGHLVVPIRPASWNTAAYLREFAAVAAAIGRLRAGIPLAGPAGVGRLPPAGRFLQAERRHVALYTQHAYPLSACPMNSHPPSQADPLFPTTERLLGLIGTYGTAASELRGVAAARKSDIPMQLTEMNSIGCNPPGSVGLDLASGLWALDQFFQDTSFGLHGVDLHIDDVAKAPFVFAGSKSRMVAFVGPLYYAMLLYSKAVGTGGSLLPPVRTAAYPTHANVRLWIVKGADGAIRAVVINKDLRQSGIVRLVVPGATHSGIVIRFAAPSISSVSGVTLGGQQIADPTRTGALTGIPRLEVIKPVDGMYAFYLREGSAAMLTIAHPARAPGSRTS